MHVWKIWSIDARRMDRMGFRNFVYSWSNKNFFFEGVLPESFFVSHFLLHHLFPVLHLPSHNVVFTLDRSLPTQKTLSSSNSINKRRLITLSHTHTLALLLDAITW